MATMELPSRSLPQGSLLRVTHGPKEDRGEGDGAWAERVSEA